MDINEADVRAALQDSTTSRVLQACISNAQSANQISAATGVPVVTVYRHTKRLLGQHLLQVERSAITDTGKPYDLYRCRLEWAHLTMATDGVKATWKVQQTMSDRLHGLWKQLEERK